MNQRDLSRTLSKTFAIPRRETTLLLRFIVEAITKSLARGNRFSLPNLGVFNPVKRASKKVRHPKTGEILTLPAYHTVSFTPAPSLKANVESILLEGIQSGKPIERDKTYWKKKRRLLSTHRK